MGAARRRAAQQAAQQGPGAGLDFGNRPVTVRSHEVLRDLRGQPLGLFKGVRTFTLTPQGGRETRFNMREEYTGPLVGMMWKSMPDLSPSFQQFASGLKRQAEAKARP